MAHFAQIDENNTVLQVLVVDNQSILDSNGVEQEQNGIDFLAGLGLGTNWKQTSYNNKFRKQYAGTGFTYDQVADVFVAPQPFPSWTLDANHDWQPPTPRPEGSYNWNEDELAWVEVPAG